MTTYVALLRGINVGGKNKIEMTKLKICFEDLGFDNVKTYINSGNVVFNDSRSEPEVVKLVEKTIKETFGHDIKVVVRNLAQIQKIVNAIPSDWVNDHTMRTDVVFLRPDIDSNGILKKISYKPEIERVFYTPGAIIWNIDRKNVTRGSLIKITQTDLYARLTIRNINTVRKLCELMLAVKL